MIKSECSKFSTDFVESEWSKLIAKSTEESTAKITQSVQTIHDELVKFIDETIKRNPSNSTELKDTLAEGIESKFGDVYSVSRADSIATTTSTFAANEGTTQAANKLNLKRLWLTQRDGDVRPTHLVLDGVEEDKNGEFHPGGDTMKFPAGGSIARENVQCRCRIFTQKK